MGKCYLMSDEPLIRSSERMYRFGVFDKYWAWISKCIQTKKIIVPECVYSNLVTKNRLVNISKHLNLNNWARTKVSKYLYYQDSDELIKNNFRQIIDYVNTKLSNVYITDPVDTFLTSTGPYLIAIAMTYGNVIVTGDGSELFSHGKLLNIHESGVDDDIKLYDVASHFEVPCINLFELEEKLNLQLN